MRHSGRAALLGALALFLCAGAANAMECPVPQSIDGANPPPAISAELKSRLSSPDVYSNAKAVYDSVKALYPKAPSHAIVDYLIANFCPIVNATPNIGDDLKKARVGSFSDALLAVAY